MITSILQALQELRVNRLRTFLSLLGITIGIFCIIAVLTVLDSMEANIRTSVSSLGSDVLYINRKPWVPEDGEYKWWEYLQRPPLGLQEARMLEARVDAVDFAAVCYGKGNQTLKAGREELTGAISYGVTPGFDKLQSLDMAQGRYLTTAELNGGNYVAVIGSEVYETLFPPGAEVSGRTFQYMGRNFMIAGVLKKVGQNIAGFKFDNAIVYPYTTAASLQNVHSMDWGNDPLIMVKARAGITSDELKDEVTGVLRSIRQIRPGGKNNFSVNQLSQVSDQLNKMFGMIDVVGILIGGFSLIVGAFGIANIMFVTVKERTKIIGLKKAIGARRRVILTEFLIEAITLCLLGGIMGIAVVLLLSLLLTYGADFPVSLSVKNFTLGLGISAFVGIISGIIPALRASRLDAVVAIRST